MTLDSRTYLLTLEMSMLFLFILLLKILKGISLFHTIEFIIDYYIGSFSFIDLLTILLVYQSSPLLVEVTHVSFVLNLIRDFLPDQKRLESISFPSSSFSSSCRFDIVFPYFRCLKSTRKERRDRRFFFIS